MLIKVRKINGDSNDCDVDIVLSGCFLSISYSGSEVSVQFHCYIFLGLPRMLLRYVCASCLNLFTEDAMENSTACWQWILSARHDLTLPFMQEMISAWQVRDKITTKRETISRSKTLNL